MTTRSLPRIVVAGLAGDSGKTLVSLGLTLAAAETGLAVRTFKKGPDYIDAAWLSWASGHPARNLDTFLMGFRQAVRSFTRHAVSGGLNIIEGNRGLYDGSDPQGTHSTAELAKRLRAPVLLAVDATKATRTLSALVLGCQMLDPEVRIGGVVLNRIGGARHERVARAAVESACGIPVLGCLPKAPAGTLLPERHLGLVTPEEHPRIGELKQNLLRLIENRLHLQGIRNLASSAPVLRSEPLPSSGLPDGRSLKIGYLRDSAFNFYYPENLEVLEKAGAEIIPISSLGSNGLPSGLNALYVGGGFPETHGAALSANRPFLRALREAARGGLPVYAECGGLMLLSRAIHWQGRRYPMAEVLPFEVEVLPSPQGHGYAEMTVDRSNPWFPMGASLRGHEFHYSRILQDGGGIETAAAMGRGTGSCRGRDGITLRNTWAAYTHLHALATPEWARALLEIAARNRNSG